MDVTRGEMVEFELDSLVKKRHDRRVTEGGERPGAEAWVESERRYDQERRRENRAPWYGWLLDRAERHRRNLEDPIAYNRARAERLCEDRGEGVR